MNHPTEPPVRSETTLRRMWDESIRLATRAQELTATADAAQRDAESHERTAAAHRAAEREARGVADAMLAEALDLVDIVNQKREQAGLPALRAGEPYDPPETSSVETVTDARTTQTPGRPADTAPTQDGGEV